MRMDELIISPMAKDSPVATALPPRLPARVELFRLFSEKGRLELLALCAEEELAVGELATLLKESQPQVSRKAAGLRQVGLLEARRDGTRTWLKTPPGALSDLL